MNLRSTSFSNTKQTASVGDIKCKATRSVDNRYSSRPTREDSLRASKTGRSFHQPCREEGLQEHGHGCDNLNGKPSQQSEVEAASNFNVVKRNALEAVHLARRTLEFTQAEANSIKQEMTALNQSLASELETFRCEFTEQCLVLTKQFRTERRGLLGDNKAISQQLIYLAEEVSTASQVSGELKVRFEAVTAQFI